MLQELRAVGALPVEKKTLNSLGMLQDAMLIRGDTNQGSGEGPSRAGAKT
jgi:hypothetical protein